MICYYKGGSSNNIIIICISVMLLLYINTIFAAKPTPIQDIVHDKRPGTHDRRILEHGRKYLQAVTTNARCVVYVMEAPVSKVTLGYTLATFNLMHAGVFFECSPAHVIGYEYNAASGVAGTLMPVSDESGKLLYDDNDLVWYNGGIIETFDQLNNTYWTRKTAVGTINRRNLAKTLMFISKYHSMFPRYKLFSIGKGKSSTCADFVFRTLEYIRDKLHVCLKAKIMPKRVVVHANEYKAQEEISLIQPKARHELQAWFTAVRRKFSMHESSFLEINEGDHRHHPSQQQHNNNNNNNSKNNQNDDKWKDIKSIFPIPAWSKRAEARLRSLVHKFKNTVAIALNKVGVFEKLMSKVHNVWYIYVSPTTVQRLTFKKWKMPVKYQYVTDKTLFNTGNRYCKQPKKRKPSCNGKGKCKCAKGTHIRALHHIKNVSYNCGKKHRPSLPSHHHRPKHPRKYAGIHKQFAKKMTTLIRTSNKNGWNFKAACVKHDLCYGRCGASKEKCDHTYHQHMKQHCRKLKSVPKQLACRGKVILIMNLIRKMASKAFKKVQTNRCVCQKRSNIHNGVHVKPGCCARYDKKHVCRQVHVTKHCMTPATSSKRRRRRRRKKKTKKKKKPSSSPPPPLPPPSKKQPKGFANKRGYPSAQESQIHNVWKELNERAKNALEKSKKYEKHADKSSKTWREEGRQRLWNKKKREELISQGIIAGNNPKATNKIKAKHENKWTDKTIWMSDKTRHVLHPKKNNGKYRKAMPDARRHAVGKEEKEAKKRKKKKMHERIRSHKLHNVHIETPWADPHKVRQQSEFTHVTFTEPGILAVYRKKAAGKLGKIHDELKLAHGDMKLLAQKKVGTDECAGWGDCPKKKKKPHLAYREGVE